MQSGDVIAILFGSPRPMMLRPRDGWYELIQPCYIYGMMEGEVVKEPEVNGAKLESFELR